MALHHNPRIVTDGLVLALDAADKNSYPGSGTTWYDLSGTSNHLTLNNGPTLDSSNGGSILFDGTDDDGVFTFFPNFEDGDPFTAACHISIPNFTDQNLNRVHWLSGGGGNSMMIFNSTTFSMWNEAGGVNNLAISYNFPTSQIFHATVTRDSNNIVSLYVDGVYIGQGSRSGQFRWVRTGKLGSVDAYSSNFNLYSMKIYNRALTASEVLQNYNATKTRFGL